jgi:uroporphyrinogen decarboxylase
MTSKERVLAAINHKVPDKIPTDLGTTNCTSIVKITYEKLKEELHIEAPNVSLFDPFQIMQVDDAVLEYLEVDTRAVPGNYDEYEQKQWIDEKTYKDMFGVTFKMPDNGLYFDFYGYPLAEYETLEEIKDNYQWPEPVNPKEVAGLAEKVKKLHDENKYAIVGDVVNSGIWERSENLRGFQNFLMDIIVNKDIAHYVLENMVEHQKKRMEQYLSVVGPYLDVVFVGDDLATNQSTVMSLESFREMVKPYFKDYWAFIKKRAPKAKLMYHSCGAIVPFLDDLIEIGVDILNPIQVNASGMDTKLLKKRFGDRLCFWGAVDAHEVMRIGSVADVEAEVRRRVGDLGPDGYVLSENHNVQADIPVKNVITLYKTAKKIAIT